MWRDIFGLAAIAKGVLAFIAADVAVPEPTNAAWPKWVAYAIASSIAISAVSLSDSESTTCGSCSKPEPICPPCKTVSGKIVLPKTLGYRPLDIIHDNVKQHGVYGSHHNIFEANQYPYPKCDCFWDKQKYVLKPEQLTASMIPVEQFIK